VNATPFGPDSVPPGGTGRRTLPVLGAPIDVLSETEAVQRIARWAQQGGSRYVCVCNAHSVVTTTTDAAFARAIAGADMATADGAPVAWMLRRLGAPQQRRVSGPELMLAYCALAALRGEAIFLYGSTPATLQALQQRLRARWPALRIAGALAPPFRPATAAEDAADVERINASGARTVWVSLGCPKQELWMAQHRGRVQAVMIGVGAAFDFHAGTVKRAPAWIRHIGFEWLHRLLSEPRRLWRRYLVGNAVFVLGAIAQWTGWRR
jgi:N-acetylglucosaminyldiphosphoundecaprenol N-acetyl-beta-D-mannosaminyltransferase